MLKRRKFLEWMAALGVSISALPLFSCAGDSPGEQAEEEVTTVDNTASQTQTVFRFQTRKARTCNACRMHARYKVFLDETTADNNRAHSGCNCRIVTQEVAEEYYDNITSFEVNGVIDLRYVS